MSASIFTCMICAYNEDGWNFRRRYVRRVAERLIVRVHLTSRGDEYTEHSGFSRGPTSNRLQVSNTSLREPRTRMFSVAAFNNSFLTEKQVRDFRVCDEVLVD